MRNVSLNAGAQTASQSGDLRRIRTSLQAAGLTVLAYRRHTAGRVAVADWESLPGPPMMDFDAETFQCGE